MKTIFASLPFSIASTFLFGQSYNLDVINGYGSGTYAAGDTVDIWSVAFYDRDYFERWTGDTTMLNDPLDWHTRLVMPSHDVLVKAMISKLSDEVFYGTTEVQAVVKM